METAQSFTARRSAASNLPTFQLPPLDHLSQIHKYPAFVPPSSSPPDPLVKSLLTPPPSDTSLSSSSSSAGVPPYQPVGYWPTPQNPLHLFSSAPPMPSSYTQQQQGNKGGRSLYSLSDGRHPPTPTYYVPSSTAPTPQQSSFPAYSQQSLTQQSPNTSSSALNKISPVSTHSHSSTTEPQAYQSRSSYSGYSLPAISSTIMSNIHTPGNQMALVGGMSIPYPPQEFENSRAFKCDQCPQSFNRNHDLKRHKRIHLTVKPFPCGHCEKSFSRKDALKRHIKVKGCGKDSEHPSKTDQEDTPAGETDLSVRSRSYPTSPRTKSPGPKEQHIHEVGSRNVGRHSKDEFEGISSSHHQRAKFFDIERALLNWVRNMQKQGHPLTDTAIEEKGRFFASAMGDNESNLKMDSTSWVEKFKQKSGIRGAESNRGASETYISDMRSPSPDSAGGSASQTLHGVSALVSSDMERVTTVLSKVGNQTFTGRQPDHSNLSSSTTIDDRCIIKPSSSTQDESSSRNNTLSSTADDDTDWGEDEIPDSIQDLHFPGFSAFSKGGLPFQDQMTDSLTRPIFSPMKQELIDRIMKEFWIIFNEEIEANHRNSSPVPVQGITSKKCTAMVRDYEPEAVRATEPAEQRKASQPQLKLGCNRCKNRRMKCDKTKPQCNKCARSGSQCDGYQVYKRAHEVSISITPPPPVESNEGQNDDTERTSGKSADSSRNASSGSFTGMPNKGQNSIQNSLGRRGRDDGDDHEQNDGDERSPKRPRTLLSPPRSQDDSAKFACPYRKRDPRKYCVQFWRPCALTPLETVARVKGHLYRHHRIFPCQRCKALFKDQAAVTLHQTQPKSCELRDIGHADGVTSEIVERLRSKKKAQKDQTEAERWKDIYKLLFPNEMIPSPYFEAIQEDLALSPDSCELADYEEYCRRELPRDFRAALEEIVHSESQPIEESIRNQLMNIIRDCQDRVFSRYRSSTAVPADTPSRNPESSYSLVPTPQDTQDAINGISMTTDETLELSFGSMAPPFLQPPPPQTHLRSRLEVSDLQNVVSKVPEMSDPSDSGYSSNESALHSGLSPFHNSSDSAPLSNSPPHAVSDLAPDREQPPLGADNALPADNAGNSSSDFCDGTFENSWLNCNSELVDGNDWNVYMNME